MKFNHPIIFSTHYGNKTMCKFVKLFTGIFIAYFVLYEVTPRLFAVFNETPNATVILKNCNRNQCKIHGTLKTNPITMKQFILKENGTVIHFQPENVEMTSWPITK